MKMPVGWHAVNLQHVDSTGKKHPPRATHWCARCFKTRFATLKKTPLPSRIFPALRAWVDRAE